MPPRANIDPAKAPFVGHRDIPTSYETFTEWRHFIDDRDPPFDQDSLPPLLALINRCLDPIPSKRPSPDDIIRLAREGVKGFREYFNHSDEKHRSGLSFRDHEIKDIPPTEIPKKQWPTMHLQNLHAVKYRNPEAPLRLPALIYSHPANLEDHPLLSHYNDIHFNKEKGVFEVGVSPSPRSVAETPNAYEDWQRRLIEAAAAALSQPKSSRDAQPLSSLPYSPPERIGSASPRSVKSDDDDVVALVRENIKTIRDRLTKAGSTTKKSGKGVTKKVLAKELVRLEREAAHG